MKLNNETLKEEIIKIASISPRFTSKYKVKDKDNKVDVSDYRVGSDTVMKGTNTNGTKKS